LARAASKGRGISVKGAETCEINIRPIPRNIGATAEPRQQNMVECDLRDQIAQLEGEIDQLADKLETCRKFMLFSKVVIGAGAIWILAYLFGAIGFDPTTMVGAIGATIGGVVLLGSNSTTAKMATTAIMSAERRRAELIDRVGPRTVSSD
jgi:hypothetical protein